MIHAALIAAVLVAGFIGLMKVPHATQVSEAVEEAHVIPAPKPQKVKSSSMQMDGVEVANLGGHHHA